MPIQNITAKDAQISDLEIGYYRSGSNTQDETPKTSIKRGSQSETFGPPNNTYRMVNNLPETDGDYYVPGSNQK